MGELPSLVQTVGLLTVITGVQQGVNGLLDERRKRRQAKNDEAAAERDQRREPLDRRSLEIGIRTEAEALADAETNRLLQRNARLEKTISDMQAELDRREVRLREQGAEITTLYQDLYRARRGGPP